MSKVFQVDTGGTLTTSLVAYWKLDEASGTRADFWSTHDMAVDTADPAQIAGKVSFGAGFTRASTQNLSAGNDSAFDNPSDFSVSYWVKGSSTTGSYQAVMSKDTGGNGWQTGLTIVTTHAYPFVTLQSNAGSNFFQRYTTVVDLADGAWHHIVVTKTGTTTPTLQIYVDGTSRALTDLGSSGAINSMSNAANVYMGRWAQGNDNYLDYSLDEFGWWTKVLSSTEVTDLYNGGSGQTMVLSGGTVATTTNNWLLMGV